MTRRAVVVVLAWAAAMVAGIVVAWHQPAVGTTPPRAEPCRWHDELTDTLALLDEDPARWVILGGDTMDSWGLADPDRGVAWIRPDTPCRLVSSVVRHEHLHLVQGEMHGGWQEAIAVYGSARRGELVADCASWLLGAPYASPVRVQAREQGVPFGCTARDLADARALLAFREGR